MAKLESGTRIYGNVTVDTFVTAVGNITGGNILTTGLFSVTGNVTANNGMFTNIVNVASHTGAVVSVTGNVTGGNILTAGLFSVTGNVTANNGMFTNIVNVASHTGAVVSVTGNVTANNGMFTTIVNVASHTGAVVSVTGNVSAGNISAVGGIVGLINPRTVTTTSNAALTPNIAVYDQYNYTALAANLTINAPTGSPVDGNKILFRIIDNGTTRTLTWNATYTAIGVTLPVATTANKMVYVGCVYNSTNTRWDAIAVSTQT